MIDTNLCRKFIVQFQKTNPHIEHARFGGSLSHEDKQALLNEKNWKRRSKVKPYASTSTHMPMDVYSIYVNGRAVNKYAEPHSKISASEIAWERQFTCDYFEDQVSYLILEKHDGTLLFGDFVGD